MEASIAGSVFGDHRCEFLAFNNDGAGEAVVFFVLEFLIVEGVERVDMDIWLAVVPQLFFLPEFLGKQFFLLELQVDLVLNGQEALALVLALPLLVLSLHLLVIVLLLLLQILLLAVRRRYAAFIGNWWLFAALQENQRLVSQLSIFALILRVDFRRCIDLLAVVVVTASLNGIGVDAVPNEVASILSGKYHIIFAIVAPTA